MIFFHELGHFAVAKWCDVNVERFSIGFGPILWSFKRGETEYALSLIPFGGYVKMLGQDDMDATQMTNEEIAQDPRSYSAKSVPQRMAIISAGVMMNIITGMLFFAIAFNIGVKTSPSVIGGTQPGYPAWKAGLDTGDRITRINDRDVETFSDLMRGVALTSGPLHIEGVHPDGKTFERDIIPDKSGTRRIIGAAPMTDSLEVIPKQVELPVAEPASSASRVKEGQGFEKGDIIKKAGLPGGEVHAFSDYAEMHRWMALSDVRKSPVDFYVERDGELVQKPITVAPTHFRRLGLRLDISKITAIAENSPADRAGFKVGDKMTHIDGIAVGTDMDPLKLPDYFYSRRPGGERESVEVDGKPEKEVVVKIARRQEEGEDKILTLRVTPVDRPGWTYMAHGENVPLSVPSIGLAYHMIPSFVLSVEPGSPAAKAKIKKGERLNKIEFVPPPDEKQDILGAEKFEITFGEKESEGKQNWAFAFRVMQMTPDRDVKLTVTDDQGKSAGSPDDARTGQRLVPAGQPGHPPRSAFGSPACSQLSGRDVDGLRAHEELRLRYLSHAAKPHRREHLA